jgi:hypothetical protein
MMNDSQKQTLTERSHHCAARGVIVIFRTTTRR